MERRACSKRLDWRERAEAIGFTFHSVGGGYWREGAYYAFSRDEVDTLRHAAEELHHIALQAVQYVLDKELLHYFMIPTEMYDYIYRSWRAGEESLYGRFDLAFDGQGQPKLLEYNADTPTSLFEAGRVQERWREDVLPLASQWNDLEPLLVERWSAVVGKASTIWFSCVKDSPEDRATVEFIANAARIAGYEARFVYVDDIGFQEGSGQFIDLDEREITHLFKLYPWEWIWGERFAPHLRASSLRCIEPGWKMLLSNKAILPVLWGLFPGHPNLLPASRYEHEVAGKRYVRKPLLSREGANITLVGEGGVTLATTGEYGREGYIHQEMASIPQYDGWHPVIGAWVIGEQAAGMGIREDASTITKNTSWFVPHVIEP